MTDAPETIFVNTDDIEDGCCPVEEDEFGDGRFYSHETATKYRRADLPLTHAQIMADPNAVHINMLHGRIANPSVEQIVHIYAGKVQAVSVEPVTLQEAAKVLHLALTEASPLDALIQAAMDRAAFTDGTSEWVFNFRAALLAIAGGRDE